MEGLKILWLQFLWRAKGLFASAKTCKPDEFEEVRETSKELVAERDRLVNLASSFLTMSPFFYNDDSSKSKTRVPFSYAVIVRHAAYGLLGDLSWLCSTRLKGTVLGTFAWNPSPEIVMAMKGFAVEYSSNASEELSAVLKLPTEQDAETTEVR